MIQESNAYTMVCDVCGKTFKSNKEVYLDKESLEGDAITGYWLLENGKCYCPLCYIIDDNDNAIIQSKKRPKSGRKKYEFSIDETVVRTVQKYVSEIVHKDSSFGELMLDEVDLVDITVDLEKELNIRINEDFLFSGDTDSMEVQDIINEIHKLTDERDKGVQ